MDIFSPFDLNSFHTQPKMNTNNSEPAINFEDPDSMYDRYIAPDLDIFEQFTSDEWKRDLKAMTQIQLDLKKKPKKIHSHQLLKEISIQISLYEALIFRDMIKNTPQKSWLLSKKKTSNQFQFQSTNETMVIGIENNQITVQKNKKRIGSLTMDMELSLLEKIHGRLFDQPFILDPIWLKSQKKVDAVTIQIDQLKTEIVHRRSHKDTLWTGGGATSRMTISKNESRSINNQLLLNAKKIHWNAWTLTSIQWLTPWYRLPVHGRYQLSQQHPLRG